MNLNSPCNLLPWNSTGCLRLCIWNSYGGSERFLRKRLHGFAFTLTAARLLRTEATVELPEEGWR